MYIVSKVVVKQTFKKDVASQIKRYEHILRVF